MNERSSTAALFIITLLTNASDSDLARLSSSPNVSHCAFSAAYSLANSLPGR